MERVEPWQRSCGEIHGQSCRRRSRKCLRPMARMTAPLTTSASPSPDASHPSEWRSMRSSNAASAGVLQGGGVCPRTPYCSCDRAQAAARGAALSRTRPARPREGAPGPSHRRAPRRRRETLPDCVRCRPVRRSAQANATRLRVTPSDHRVWLDLDPILVLVGARPSVLGARPVAFVAGIYRGFSG